MESQISGVVSIKERVAFREDRPESNPIFMRSGIEWRSSVILSMNQSRSVQKTTGNLSPAADVKVSEENKSANNRF